MRAYLAILVLATWGIGALLFIGRRTEWVRRVESWSALGLALASLSLAYLHHHWETSIHFVWIREFEPVGLSYHAPGIYLAMMAFGALAVSTWLPMRSSRRSGPTAWPGMLHLLCGLVVAALTVDHLLARIVLLDLTAVGVLLVLYRSEASMGGQYPILRRYMVFRLGDMGLMLTALLLWQAADTWLIEELFAQSRVLLPVPRTVAALSGLVAVGVKMGLPPFHRWFQEATRLPRSSMLWLTSASLPVLGAYLAYRIRPLLVWQPMGLVATLAGAAITIWSTVNVYRTHRAGDEYGSYLLIAHSALGLALVQTGVMRAHVLAFLPIRAVLCLLLPEQAWAPSAHVKHDSDPNRLPVELRALSHLASQSERSALEATNHRLAEAMQCLANWTATHLDDRMDGGLAQMAALAASRLGEFLQHHHTGRLRRNMLWASLGLIVVITAIVSSHII